MRAVLLLSTVVFLTSGPAPAETLPTKGTFDGFYHRDRWGVGHFGFFIVRPDLHAALGPYDGKPIRLEVTKGVQPKNPGPAIMLEIGSIEPLSPAPLDVDISTIPCNLEPGAPFQLILNLTNTTEKTLTVPVSGVVVVLYGPSDLPGGGEPNAPSWLVPEYTKAQMNVRYLRHIQLGQVIAKTDQREYANLAHGSYILIDPNDRFPLVIFFDRGLDAGEYELQATVNGPRPGVPAYGGQKLDIPKTGRPSSAAEPLRVLHRNIERTDDWYLFEMTVAPPKGRTVRRVAFEMPEPAGFAGRIRAFAKDGTPIALKAARIFADGSSSEYDPPARGRYRMSTMPEKGLKIVGKLRPATPLRKPVHKILLDILTDRGAETLTLMQEADDLGACPDLMGSRKTTPGRLFDHDLLDAGRPSVL
ncbi:MAG: hypothetical protein JSU94_14525 [Phycisphaerales bacterium]|nr:MAG: hypothetical protein JSU94_14525 [Phycisphaerales bacterium]